MKMINTLLAKIKPSNSNGCEGLRKRLHNKQAEVLDKLDKRTKFVRERTQVVRNG